MSTPLRDAAIAGDSVRFGQAYDLYAPVLYALLLRILHNEEDAQEVLQETFLVSWSKPSAFDPARGSELAWLITMARSRGIDRLRSRTRRIQREEKAAHEIYSSVPSVVPSGTGSLELAEIRSAVRDALEQLPAAQQMALKLAYFDDLSQSEIAARLDEPLGTIKTRTVLGMKRLRETLGALRRR